ncbi:MAG: hypothetical protein EON58_17745 [Alphaproteobacteria bacterium]|nr:MAG: hypothetical protein EON58_17745 [Alphaproteobacteria bacterium]
MRFTVKRFPIGQEQIYSAQTSGWYADANFGATDGTGSVVTLSLGTVTTRSTMGLAANIGAINTSPVSSIPVGPACQLTAGVPGQTTCASGSIHVGAAIDVPQAGKVEACFAFAHGTNIAAGGNIHTHFTIAETNAAGDTILQQGREYSGDYLTQATQVSAERPHKNCSAFDLTAGRKYFRLMYTQSGTNVTQSYLIADRLPDRSSRDIHITIKPMTQQTPMPVFVGPNEQTRTVTTATTAAPGDTYLVADSTSGAFSITLPSAAVAGAGKKLVLTKKNQSNAITVNAIAGQTVGAVSSFMLLGRDDSVRMFSDGANWQWEGESGFRNIKFIFAAPGGEAVPCTGGSCTITSSNDPGAATAWTSTGNYSPTVTNGAFSDKPKCEGNPLSTSSGGPDAIPTMGYATPNSYAIYFRRSSNEAADNVSAFFRCWGPR